MTGECPAFLADRLASDDSKCALGGDRGLHVRESVRLELPNADAALATVVATARHSGDALTAAQGHYMRRRWRNIGTSLGRSIDRSCETCAFVHDRTEEI
jgi:hypothetical protein